MMRDGSQADKGQQQPTDAKNKGSNISRVISFIFSGMGRLHSSSSGQTSMTHPSNEALPPYLVLFLFLRLNRPIDNGAVSCTSAFDAFPHPTSLYTPTNSVPPNFTSSPTNPNSLPPNLPPPSNNDVTNSQHNNRLPPRPFHCVRRGP